MPLAVNWKHIFDIQKSKYWIGKSKDYRDVKPTGFHSEFLRKYIIKEETFLGPDKNGIYKQDFVWNGMQKSSTFFLKDWSPKKIKTKCMEAYSNGISSPQSQMQGLIGTTAEGIKIQFWFGYDPKKNIFYIKSIFPYLDL